MSDEIRAERFSGPLGYKTANPVACMTCLNSMGEPPWADSPNKSYCVAFPREEGRRKPPEVYYDGSDCPMHRPRSK